jgi:hypothetical protein
MIAEHVFHESLTAGENRPPRLAFTVRGLIEVIAVVLFGVGSGAMLVDEISLQKGEKVW